MTENEKSPERNPFSHGNAQKLIDYQADSVVSREMVKKDAGTVTVFAFDQGQGLSEHTAPFDALVHVLDGTVEISIDRKPQRFQQGDLVLMPANIPHALKAVERFKMLLVMIKSK